MAAIVDLIDRLLGDLLHCRLDVVRTLRQMWYGDGDVVARISKFKPRLLAVSQIKLRLLNEQNRAFFSETRKKLLWSLPDEIPSQMAKRQDPYWLILSLLYG